MHVMSFLGFPSISLASATSKLELQPLPSTPLSPSLLQPFSSTSPCNCSNLYHTPSLVAPSIYCTLRVILNLSTLKFPQVSWSSSICFSSITWYLSAFQCAFNMHHVLQMRFLTCPLTLHILINLHFYE